MKHYFLLLTLVFILTACAPAQAETPTPTPLPPTATTTPTETPTPSPTATLTPSITPTPPPKTPAIIYDVSGLRFGRYFPPECIDQFPVTPDTQGMSAINVVFDNWIFGDIDNPIMLGGGYEMMAGAEAWYQQDGQNIPVIVPLAVVHRRIGILDAVTNRGGRSEYHDFMYDGNRSILEDYTETRPGKTLKVFMAVPTEELASYSTEGFGFRVANFNQANIDVLFATGDATGFGNILWPAIHIVNTEEWPPTPTPVPPTPIAVTAVEGKATFDNENVTLEHPIDPECQNQFPVTQESSVGSQVLCVTFDNWILSDKDNPIMLDGDYEMIAGAEGWFEQDGQKVAVIIPLATRNRETNESQANRTLPRDFREGLYDASGKFWESVTTLQPGISLNVIINLEGMADGTLSNNSTQGFGFEAVAYTQEDVDDLFTSGDTAGFGNILWPVIDIAKRH